ncbi:MAG TPA: hypothetical protein DCQ76_06575 [Ruminococcaceae bacterium]|nr:hypothetical protein [Oscillospiraceae bacterium]
MLKLLDEETDLDAVLSGKREISLAAKYIEFMMSGGNHIGVWAQTDENADASALVLKKKNGDVLVCRFKGCDEEELSEFTGFLGGDVFICSENDDCAERIFMVLSDLPQTPTSSESLFDITSSEYAVLTGVKPKENDRAFLEWLSKTSRGVFGGGTKIKCVRENGKTVSLAAGDIIGKDAYIRDVATSENYRGRGFAADCVISLSRELKKTADCIFLMCKPENAKLYEKCGFRKKEYIIRKNVK